MSKTRNSDETINGPLMMVLAVPVMLVACVVVMIVGAVGLFKWSFGTLLMRPAKEQ